jgi:hypothetical protein
MSNTITATVHSDAELASIRNMVAIKNDGIPFLLLPVKVETRFMTVDVPIYVGDTFPGLLEDLYVVIDDLIFDPSIYMRDDVLRRIRSINTRLDAIATQSGGVKRLNGVEKNLLSQKSLAMGSVADKLLAGLSRLQWTNQTDIAELRVLRTALASKTTAAKASVAQLSTTQGAGDGNTTDFIQTMKSMQTTMAAIGRQSFELKTRLSKRTLHATTDAHFASLNEGMQSLQRKLDVDMTATKREMTEIDTQIEALSTKLQQSLRNVDLMQSAYKKAEYLAAGAAMSSEIKRLRTIVDARLRPKLELKAELRTVDARQLMVQVNEVRFWLRQGNLKPFGTYLEVKTTRERLYEMLHALRVQIHKVLEGDPEDITALRNAWDQTDAELERFVQRVKRLKVERATEKAGLTRTVTHINKEYRRDLSGLKTGALSSFPELTHSVLEQSNTVYASALNEIGQVNAVLQQTSGSPARLPDVVQAVTNLNHKLSTDFRSLHILPESKFNLLREASTMLSESMSRVLASVGDDQDDEVLSLKATAEGAAAGITANVNAQVSDALNRKDRFYDEVRPGIVFAPKTKTQKELWVRIFPDDIAVHTHETALTQAELDSGKAYWFEIWAAGSDADLKLAAWRAISTAYGSQRAAWIVKATDPGTISPASASAFEGLYADIIAVNTTITVVNSMLQKGIDAKSDAFKVLGDALPYINSEASQLGKITKANETLLVKSRRLLLKTQSLLGKYFAAINNLSAEVRNSLGSQMAVVQLVQDAFAKTVAAFQTVRPEKTAVAIANPALIPLFPAVTIKEGSWTEAPHSRVMPNRFVVLAVRGGQYRYVEVGNPLPANRLVVGLDPDSFSSETFSYDADGNLIVDPNIKWLTDFKEARNIGMAISFAIDQSDWDNGFDKVVVLGVKDSSSSHGRTLIQDLINNHHYIPEGASFLPVGTPTNNTESGQSGYRTFESDAATSFEIERRSESGIADVSDPNHLADYERLADALGISRSTLQYLDYSKETEVSDALLMNRALFPGTLGGFMEDGMDTLFTVDNIERTKTFFNQYVSARGYLPSIRIGTQPYGILPTTALSYFECTADDSQLPLLSETDFQNVAAIQPELQTRFDIRLKTMLRFGNALFTTIRNSKVKYSGNTDPANPQGHFMEMLGLQAASVERYYRYGLNVAARQGAGEVGEIKVTFSDTDVYGPVNANAVFNGLVVPGYYYQSDKFQDELDATLTPAARQTARASRIMTQFNDMRVFAMRHLAEQEQLLGETIDHRELSDTVQTPTPITGVEADDFVAFSELEHYIDWVTTQNPWDVHAANAFSTLDGETITNGMPAKSLLFQLLRHSMLSAYAEAVLSILEHEGLIDQKVRRKVGQAKYYYSRYATSYNYVTKWTFLFSRIEPLSVVLGADMDPLNPFYDYMHDLGTYGYLNRYVSPEHVSIYNGYPGHAAHDAYMAKLNATRTAIQQLKTVPTASLDKLLAEHLDLCSYRLDAWYLGLANKRLAEQRAVQSTGIYIGAYGYVESLKRGGALTPAQNIPAGLWKNGDAPIYTDADSLGFIHSPSLNHAITAAVLRAGFHSNEATAEVDNQMAVNLSSERVRMALNLLNGIRGGQESGALLGFQFERGLHERYPTLELDAYIYDFRDAFPLSMPVEGVTAPMGTVPLTNVVNGMDLLEFAQDFVDSQGGPANLGDSLYQSLVGFGTQFWAQSELAFLSITAHPTLNAERDAICKEIDRMANAFDALGDLCVSESIYQMTSGNHVRASAILDQLAKGDVPAEIAITDTPRTGTVVTQKVALFMPRIAAIDHVLTASGTDSTPLADTAIDAAVTTAGASPAGWNARFGPRALLEPSLNKWVGEMMGDPAHIKCLVDYEFTDSTEVTTVGTITVSLADLGLQPLDALHLFGTGALIGGAELNARIAVYARTQLPVLPITFAGTTDDVGLTIRFTERDGSWTSDDYSFYEKAGFIQALRSFTTSSSILSADHLHIPGEEEVAEDEIRNQDVDDLSIRVSNAYARLKAVQSGFTAFFDTEIDPEEINAHTYSNAQIDSLRSLLTQAAAFGLPSSLPELAVSYGDVVGRVLMTSAIGVANGITDRINRADVELLKANDTTLPNDPRVDCFIEAARCLMGPAFKLLPQFTIRNSTELSTQLSLTTSQGLLRAAAPEAMSSWSQGVGRVRERMVTVDLLEMLCDNFGQAMPAMTPVQLPFALDGGGVAVDHWLGLPYPVGYAPTEDKLSLVLFNAAEVTSNPTAPKVAILVDEWVEIIPNRQETTGITFNYDQPDAKAPNTILLAVTPKVTGHWVWDDLVHTIEDTVELAKNRAVEPEHLEDTVFGQILPGILMEIVPPTSSGVSFDPTDNPLGMQVVTDFKVNNETVPAEE